MKIAKNNSTENQALHSVGSRGSCQQIREDPKYYEILFSAKDPRFNTSKKVYDGIALSLIRWEVGEYKIPMVEIFKDLGSYLSTKCNNDFDVANRIASAKKKVGSLR